MAMNEEQASELCAQVVQGCSNLDECLAFFVDKAGFRIKTIFPADSPHTAVLVSQGIHLRLEQGTDYPACTLRLFTESTELHKTLVVAPNGTNIQWHLNNSPMIIPDNKPSLCLSRIADDHCWIKGRAGMLYRDLIPDRQGGRFIASHIRIPMGGPVPDYTHYHKVRFQFIFCYKGWVKLVYEDQGEPFVMKAGDCVLQPPKIRHRVLESSNNLEVIEVGCPAEHETHADLEMGLPTGCLNPERIFSGQKFTFHEAEKAQWEEDRTGFESRDTGLAKATGNLLSLKVLRPGKREVLDPQEHDGEFLFYFMLEGSLQLTPGDNQVIQLSAGDSVVIPAGERYSLELEGTAARLLEVRLPGFNSI